MMPHSLLLQTVRRYPGWMLLTIVLGFSGAVFNGVSTALIVPVLLSFLGQPLELPPLLSQLMVWPPLNTISPDVRLGLLTVAIALLIGLKNLAMYLSTVVSGILKRNLVCQMREDGLQLLLEVDLDFFARTGMGDVMNRLNMEVGRAAAAIATLVRSLTTVLTILVFAGLLLVLSWPLTLISTGLLGGVLLVNQAEIARSRQAGEHLSTASKAYSMNLLDVLTGMRLVRSTANETHEFQRLRRLVYEREQAEYASLASSAAIAPLTEIAGVMALIGIVWMGRAVLTEQVEALSTVLLTYLLIIFRLLPLIAQLNQARTQVANTAPSIDITRNFLRRDDKPFMANGTVPFTSLRDSICFERVSFRYSTQAEWALHEVSLVIPRGTKVAVVGTSGAGKSTLADLLPRFYDPTQGRIVIDGRDLREFNLHTLRRAMGIISQETVLFNATVRANLTYGCPEATEADLWAAAKLANADSFIAQLPHGLETPIGDRGVMLSGGQRQRLAIARALLQNPEILILDEATSALDSVSERLVQDALERLSCDRTTLVIAHRLSTIQDADQIVVLDRGHVMEQGTHEELLKQGGYYARFYTLQLSPDSDAQARRSILARTSYEMRSRLTTILGSLKLLADGAFDSATERIELTEEAYGSTLRVLQSLEQLERQPEPLTPTGLRDIEPDPSAESGRSPES